MLEFQDILSGIVGLVLFTLGLLPILNKFGVGPDWFSLTFLPVAIFSWIIAVGALYLVVNSVIEITNSSPIGAFSVIVAFLCLTIAILPILSGFGIGPDFFALGFLGGLGEYLFFILFMVEGLFLLIAMIAMEM